MQMMENGVGPENDGKLVLTHEKLWSAEASNFIDIAGWGILDDLASVSLSLTL
jgi:hypothetical protein